MQCIEDGGTAIQEFYRGTNVLITGGTGFMGKALTEKLLRSCDVNIIYLLIRSKKGKDVDTRLEELFNDPLFDCLKEKSPKFRHKVIAVNGDCSAPGLGLSPSDRKRLAEDVNIVFHGAATVRFDEKMRLAVGINVLGTRNILDLAREISQLKALIHVSTAYCNCHLKEIEEQFYNYPITYKKLLSIMDNVNDKMLDNITPTPQTDDEIPIYNYVSSVQKPITWGDFMEKGAHYGIQIPTMRAVWCYSLTLNKYRSWHMLYVLFLHFLPAFIIDGIAIVVGKQPKLVKIYKKINKFSDVISYFCIRDWKFTNNNVQSLWKKMEKGDKGLFDFDMDDLDWEKYFYGYVRGIRLYLIKDDPSTIPQAILKHKRLYWLHQSMKAIVIFLIVRCLWSLWMLVI
ncbi:hypothetical protein C0J52_07924 [Blattella germanica]|nr:hypothetical protein C0J52_07924 [Blattella germanica]